MKKVLFGFIATIVFGFVGSAQNSTLEYFAQLDPIKTAQIHNDVLSDLIELRKKDPKLSIKDALLKLEIDLSIEDRISIYNYISNNHDAKENSEKVLLNLNSQKAKVIYNKINEIIEENKDYTTLVNSVNNELTIAGKELNDFDLKVIQLLAETSKASAKYWYTIYNDPSGKTAPPDWVKKDGNGIAQASVGWAIGAAVYGGGLGGYFLACGVGGALASIWP